MKSREQTMKQYKTDSSIYQEMKVKKCNLTEEPGVGKIVVVVVVVVIVVVVEVVVA